MYRAHGIVVLELGCALKGGGAGPDLHQREIKRVGDMRIRQLAAEHTLQQFQTALTPDFGRIHHPRPASACAHALDDRDAILVPLGLNCGKGHRYLSRLRINSACIYNYCIRKYPRTSMSNETASRPNGCSNFKLRQLMRRVSQHYDAELGKA